MHIDTPHCFSSGQMRQNWIFLGSHISPTVKHGGGLVMLFSGIKMVLLCVAYHLLPGLFYVFYNSKCLAASGIWSSNTPEHLNYFWWVVYASLERSTLRSPSSTGVHTCISVLPAMFPTWDEAPKTWGKWGDLAVKLKLLLASKLEFQPCSSQPWNWLQTIFRLTFARTSAFLE